MGFVHCCIRNKTGSQYILLDKWTKEGNFQTQGDQEMLGTQHFNKYSLQEPGKSTEPNSLQRETQRAPKSNAKSWINKTFRLNKWGLEQDLSNVWDSRNVLFYGSLYSSLNYASAVSRSTTKGQDTEILSFVVWWIESELSPNRLMFYFICIRFCLYMCLGTMRMAVPVDAREGYQIPWNQLSNGSVF